MAIAALFVFFPLWAEAATFIVNTTNDDGDVNFGDGVCSTGQLLVLPGGLFVWECTLRAAIEEANASSDFDYVEFSHTLPEVTTDIVEIAPQRPMPVISNPLLVDGYSHPDYDQANPEATPVIQLVGGAAGPGASGLTFLGQATGGGVRGLAIADFAGSGIRVSGFMPGGLGFEGNHIGVSRGVFYRGNGRHGIELIGARAVVVGQVCTPFLGCALRKGNLISGNVANGILVDGSSVEIHIAGNTIGTDRTGTTTFLSLGGGTANGGWGIELGPNVTDSQVGMIGGLAQPPGAPTPVASGNLISGNGAGGVVVRGNANTLRANRIGTNAAGTSALPNTGPGVQVDGDDNRIGNVGLESNLISGNDLSGILADVGFGASPARTIIQGNRIGVDATGTAPIGNGEDGIFLRGEDGQIVDNVVGGNHSGIVLRGDGGQILRNYVGTNTLGNDLGNVVRGIEVEASDVDLGSSDNGNVVGFNRFGIVVGASSSSISIQGNFIGADASGAPISNESYGVGTSGDSVLIGGARRSEANVIGHNGGPGLFLITEGTTVSGNFIGTNASGADLGNAAEGILLEILNPGLFATVIGADVSDVDADVVAKGNVIANNRLAGLALQGDDEVALRGNLFWNNGGTPIDLGANGETPNDVGDFDAGANQLANHPVFDVAHTFWDGATREITVRYRVDSEMAAGVQYPLIIDFFVHSPWLEPGDQARVLVGTDTYDAADATNFKTVTFSPLDGTVVPNTLGFVFEGLRATATDQAGNTSELSTQSVPVPEPGTPLSLLAGGFVLARMSRRSRRGPSAAEHVSARRSACSEQTGSGA